MDAARLLTGLALGFSIAAPIGPIGVLCIQRTLRGGWAVGLASGLGAATADAAYGAVAAFGVTTLSGLLVRNQTWIGWIGGAFLVWLGIRALTVPVAEAAGTPDTRPAAAYASTLALTLANPATVLSFAAAFSAMHLGAPRGWASAASLVAGVLAGSSLWWGLLCGGVSLARSRLDDRWIRALNRASGALLIVFGLIAAAWPHP